MLEDAIAISVLTFVVCEAAYFSRLHINDVNTLYVLRDFCAVSTDVLHGTCTDFARDERKVGQTIITMAYCPTHKIIPNLCGTNAQMDILCRFIKYLLTIYRRVEHYHIIVLLCEEQIATATDVQYTLRTKYAVSNIVLQFLYRMILQHLTTFCVDAKSIILK